MRLLADGWDNAVYLVDERWAFRFPQRSVAVAGLEREIAVLPQLAPSLPLPVPAPNFIGAASDEYPWPFFGARFLPGQELADAALDAQQVAGLAQALGRFLRALHAPAVFAGLEMRLPADPMRRRDMGLRVPRTRSRLDEVTKAGLWSVPAAVGTWLDTAERLSTPAPSVVVHGDLHIRHVLVSERGDVSGIIDWGDLALSDACVDLSLGWALFADDAREEFLAAHGGVDDETRLRARVLALFLCAALATYANDRRRETLLRASINALATAAQP